ncbi:Hypothetical predicted protein [Mytilus galloprovincialis]|uniref:Uncharacterized protein n=1 Tax=Mytilus galloprovincialis TaxID=29158 RepID=A0A8B6DI47_MYTGA|nr:Hypothetical predicted protein [Mytilus galloprovincialis]
MNLTCDVVTGNPAETMFWEYGHEVVAKGGPGSLKYTFTPNSTQHLQTFRCVAFNNITKTPLTENVTLHVYSEPTVKIFPSGTINIIEDESLLLECKYTSNDNRDTLVIWYKFDDNIIQKPNTILELYNIKRYHAGNYSCSVSNSVGTTKDTVTVNVLYSPAVSIIFLDQQLVKCLRCNAHGNPADYVFSAWEHRTEYGDHIRFLNDSGGGYIELEHSSRETVRHHDQGIYICTVSNGIMSNGKTKQMANFTLKQKGLPYIPTINNRMKYEISGKETNLTLNVVSYPVIKTVMVLNNLSVIIKDLSYQFMNIPSKIEDIVYGTKVNVKGYNLSIQFKINVSDDFTTYTIRVTNDYGVCNISVDIRSARPLKAPHNVKAVPLDFKIIVKWTANRNIRSQEIFQVEYRIHFESSWSRVSAGNRSTAIINGLQPDTAYFVRVYSKTPAGESDRSDFNMCFSRTPPSRRNEETSVRIPQYDEIDSMYYNPLNITVSPVNTRNDIPLGITENVTRNANTDICNTNNSSNRRITPAIIHHFNNSQENITLRSSSDESYLVPCRNYLDLDIEKVTEDEQPAISVASSFESYLVPCSSYPDLDIEETTENEQVTSINDSEISVDESSVSSDNSDTNIKSIQKYEKLRLSDMNGQSNTEHTYNYIDT